MTRRTFMVLHVAVAAALGIVVAWSIIARNFLVAVIAVVLAVGISYLLRKATREVTQDERSSLLYEKAAGAIFRFTVPIVGVGAVILLALQDHLNDDAVLAAYILASTVCVMLLVHLAFYAYYSRKH